MPNLLAWLSGTPAEGASQEQQQAALRALARVSSQPAGAASLLEAGAVDVLGKLASSRGALAGEAQKVGRCTHDSPAHAAISHTAHPTG